MIDLAESSTPSADYIVTILRTQHREYLRKDLHRLKAQVEAAVHQILGTGDASSTTSESRKRKALEDEEYDRAAAEEEETRERVSAGGGLNASLRDRYRQVQQVRDVGAAATVTDAVDEEADDVKIEQGSDKQGSDAAGKKTKGATKGDKSASIKRRAVKSRKSPGGSMLASSTSNDSAFLTPVMRPTERYADLGGMTAIIQQIRQLVEYPLIRPELYLHLGVDPPRGVLLRGPPGTGKTHLAKAVAGQLGIAYFQVSAPELVSGMSGESEGRIRDLFKAASDIAPAIIFLDELDAIAPKRSEGGSSRGMEKRMVAQLLTSMDMLAPQNNNQNAAVLVLAATNRPDAMDPALRRAGRFDKEILMGVPDEAGREAILRTMTKGMRLSGDMDYKSLARKTPGFVGADVKSLAKEAAVLAINRIFQDVLTEQGIPHFGVENDPHAGAHDGEPEAKDAPDQSVECSAVTPLSSEQMDPLYVTMDDFLAALPLVQPSSKREGFATVPDVSWDKIGALQRIREELTMSVLEPIRNPEKFQALGLPLPAGVMLYGPPGCGKTLLAKAIANESGANFISVKGPELLDKYVGESEKAVRLVFERARSSSPCIVFFDELDSLVPRRGSDGGSGGVSERVVNQLLTEMDGMEKRHTIFVIAATNRPELIDPAMLRPGRLDKLLYVPLPTPEDRVAILKALAIGIKLGEDVDLDAIGMSPRSEGYSGADCAALLREAGLAVLKEDAAIDASVRQDASLLRINTIHFDRAFSNVMPSVSKKDQARYDRIRNRMARARCRSVETIEETGPIIGTPMDTEESGPNFETPMTTAGEADDAAKA
jgi:ribosome biogenesis ATPase